jgi:hypothetical protein
VPFTQRRSVLSSEFLDSLKGLDQSPTNIRHFDAILIADYVIAIGEIEVVARWHEKHPCFSYKSRAATKSSSYLSKSPLVASV